MAYTVPIDAHLAKAFEESLDTEPMFEDHGVRMLNDERLAGSNELFIQMYADERPHRTSKCAIRTVT